MMGVSTGTVPTILYNTYTSKSVWYVLPNDVNAYVMSYHMYPPNTIGLDMCRVSES
jgi:hypothetical protein